ncbi:hypothetical protein [Bradyrhizobium elkanii]|uniref:hypothetical protein n=1 Tax=Bradyrhizobium elkanii TaxID=29448 RepID=UPI00272B7953|nr:hypothetical protein [Bradyrhizobium elkanii]WLA80290.1 hypothetical protein QNJ99_33630 [Bradyrhizobium elkanii]
MLTIETPNTDRSLLTLAELRAAAGVSDGSQDAVLVPLGNYVSAAITKACKVAYAGVIPPTLRMETVTETLRYTVRRGKSDGLVLARRPVVEIVSVTESGSEVAVNGYQLDAAAAILYRVSGNCPILWNCFGDIVVEYSAGYAVVPDDLKYAAIKFVRAETATGSRDPMLKRIRIEGVSEREYWVDPTKDSIIPGEVMDILVRGGYVNMVVA